MLSEQIFCEETGITFAQEVGMYEQDDAQLEDLFDGIDAAETWEYATDDELDSY